MRRGHPRTERNEAVSKPLNLFDRFIVGFNFEKPGKWQDNALNLDAWKAWDRAQRQRLGFFSGLKFWSKTNTPGSRVLLARHWPHRLCWDWSIWVGFYRGAKYDGPRKFLLSVSRKYRSINVSLFFVNAHITWQNYSYMGGLGPTGTECPQIIWAHHLQHAEPMGTA
jgi:hypothetical protein